MEAGDGAPLAVLQHGFTRTPRALDGLAGCLADRGISSVRPWLRSLRRADGFNDPGHLAELGREISAAAAGRALIGIGHSAGAAAVVHMAAESGRFRGLLLIDGVDSPWRPMSRGLSALADVPILVVAGEPSPCNRHGEAIGLLAARRPGALGVRITGGGHGDIERVRVGRRARAVYRLACQDRSGPDEVRLLELLVVDWAEALTASALHPGELPVAPILAPLVDEGRLTLLPSMS